jgi:hypothetical protein
MASSFARGIIVPVGFPLHDKDDNTNSLNTTAQG